MADNQNTTLTTGFVDSRLSAFANAVAIVSELEFPNADAKDLVSKIKTRILEKLAVCRSLQSDDLPEDISRFHAAAAQDLERFAPIVSYAARSTDSRNPHEFRAPFLSIARRALGEQTRLVLFSEWFPFPLLYRFNDPSDLGQFLLVGFPTHESENPLIFPLAGHELGHSLWRLAKNDISKVISDSVTNLVREDFANQWMEIFKVEPKSYTVDLLWDQLPFGTSVEWALKQAEEIFCDLIGFYCFGEAYLHAFHYAIAGHGLTIPTYPTYLARGKALSLAYEKLAGKKWHGPEFPGRASPAARKGQFGDRVNTLLRDIADQAISEAAEDILTSALRTSEESHLLHWKQDGQWDEAARVGAAELLAGVPVLNARFVQDILTALWRADLSIRNTFQEAADLGGGEPVDYSTMTKSRRLLQEAALKSLEVFEIQQIEKEPLR